MKHLSPFLAVGLAAAFWGAAEPSDSAEERKAATPVPGKNGANPVSPKEAAAASGVAGALAERQSKARALMREADSLSREGKLQEAMDKFDAALALHPEAPGEQAFHWCRSVDAEINPVPIIQLADLPRAERRGRFERAVGTVAAEHGFTWPQFFEKTGSAWVAVCARPRLRPLSQEREPTSSWEVLQAVFETTPDHRMTLKLIPFSYGPSSWATLGPVFYIPLGITRERAEMAKQLQAELRR